MTRISFKETGFGITADVAFACAKLIAENSAEVGRGSNDMAGIESFTVLEVPDCMTASGFADECLSGGFPDPTGSTCIALHVEEDSWMFFGWTDMQDGPRVRECVDLMTPSDEELCLGVEV